MDIQGLREALQSFYKKYSPDNYSDEKIENLVTKYGDQPDELFNSLYQKYAGKSISKRELYGIKDKYGLYSRTPINDYVKNLESDERGYQSFNNGGGGQGAVGAYQIRFKTHSPEIKKVTGIDDINEFYSSPSAQEDYMDHLVNNVYLPNLPELKSIAKERNLDITDEELLYTQHHEGVSGAKNFISTGKSDFGSEEILKKQYARGRNYLSNNLVSPLGSAQEPIKIFEDGIDQSKFNKELLDDLYSKSGGDPSKQYTAKISKKVTQGTAYAAKLNNTYNIEFDNGNTITYFEREYADFGEKLSNAISSILSPVGSQLLSVGGMGPGLLQDTFEYVASGGEDDSFDKTFDYASNYASEKLQKESVIIEESDEKYKEIQSRIKEAEESKNWKDQALANVEILGQSEFWSEHGFSGVGSMLGFLIPGMAAGKLVKGVAGAFQIVGKAPWLSKKLVEKGSQYLVGSSVMASMEAGIEAGETFKNSADFLMNEKGLSEEEARAQAADYASEAFGVNYAMLMITNAVELGGVFGTLSRMKGLKRIPGIVIPSALSEAAEESFQFGTQEYSSRYKDTEYDPDSVGLFDSIGSNQGSAFGGALNATAEALLDGNPEAWMSATLGGILGSGTSTLGGAISTYNYYKKEKPLMKDLESSLPLSPKDIYKTDSNGEVIYKEGKATIDPTKYFSNLKGIADISLLDEAQQDALNKDDSESLKFLQAAKISHILHNHYRKNTDSDSIENAIKNTLTKENYEQSGLSNYFSYKDFKEMRERVIDLSQENYEKIYSDPKLKSQSASFKQNLYHNNIQQQLLNDELSKYQSRLDSLNSKGEKLTSLEKSETKDLTSKIESLNKFKTSLDNAYNNIISNKKADAKTVKEEEEKEKVKRDFKAGKSEEEILNNATDKKSTSDALKDAKRQSVIDELDTYSSLTQYHSAINKYPEFSKEINDHLTEKLNIQSKSKLTNVDQINGRYGQENTLLREHEEGMVGSELKKILVSKSNLWEEIAHYEALRDDPTHQFNPDPELQWLGEHILKGGTFETYTQGFNEDNTRDPLLQDAINSTNNIKKEEPSLKESKINPKVERGRRLEENFNKAIAEKKFNKTKAKEVIDQELADGKIGKREYNKLNKIIDLQPDSKVDEDNPVLKNDTDRGFEEPGESTTLLALAQSFITKEGIKLDIIRDGEIVDQITVKKNSWLAIQSSNLSDMTDDQVAEFKYVPGNSYRPSLSSDNIDKLNLQNALNVGDTIYYEIDIQDEFLNKNDVNSFAIQVVVYTNDGKIVKKEDSNKRNVIGYYPSTSNKYSTSNKAEAEIIRRTRKDAYKRWDKASNMSVGQTKVTSVSRRPGYHKGKFRKLTKEEIKKFKFDTVIQLFEDTTPAFSSTAKSFEEGFETPMFSTIGQSHVEVGPQDVGSIYMFIPSNEDGEKSVAIKLNTVTLKEVPNLYNKLLSELQKIDEIEDYDQKVVALNAFWKNNIGNKYGNVRVRTQESSFDTDSKVGKVNPRGGIGPVLLPGFIYKNKEGQEKDLSANEVMQRLGDIRVNIRHDDVKTIISSFPELVETDLMEPIPNEYDLNVSYDVNIRVEPNISKEEIVEIKEESKVDKLSKTKDNPEKRQKQNPKFKATNKDYSGNGAMDYMKQRFEDVGIIVSDSSLEILKELYEIGDQKIWGAFYKAVVYLSSDAGTNVGKHEAFHVLFNLFLNDKQKDQILNELFDLVKADPKQYPQFTKYTKEDLRKALENKESQGLLTMLEEAGADLMEEYKYAGFVSEDFKNKYPTFSKFIEAILDFLYDQYQRLKPYLTDSITLNDIFYQLDNNIFGRNYSGKRRKKFREIFSKNFAELYGIDPRFKVGDLTTSQVRKYASFIARDVFKTMLINEDGESVNKLSDGLKNLDSIELGIYELMSKLPERLQEIFDNENTSEKLRNTISEIQKVLDNEIFRRYIIAEVNKLTGYGISIEEKNSDETIGDESQEVIRNLNIDPTKSLKGKLREYLSSIEKTDDDGYILTDDETGTNLYYDFREVVNGLYDKLTNSISPEDMWSKILEASKSFKYFDYIKQGIELGSENGNIDRSLLFQMMWNKFGSQRSINYIHTEMKSDGTVNVYQDTRSHVSESILKSAGNEYSIFGKPKQIDVIKENLWKLYNSYGINIDKESIERFNDVDSNIAIENFKIITSYKSGNPFVIDDNEVKTINPVIRLIDLYVKYSPDLKEKVIYTINNEKEFIVQNSNFITRIFDAIKSRDASYFNKYKNSILHDKLPIYKLIDSPSSKKWSLHYNNGFKANRALKGTEYRNFTDKNIYQEMINKYFYRNDSERYIMVPTFSDATSQAFVKVTTYSDELLVAMIAETAIAELSRIKFSKDNKTGYKNFDKNGKRFLLTPFMNQYISELLSITNEDLLSTRVRAIVEIEINKNFEKYLNKLLDLNLISKRFVSLKDGSFIETYDSMNGLDPHSLGSSSELKLRNQYLNQYFWNTQLIPLLAGDPAYYKPNSAEGLSVSIDLLKRYKQAHSPGAYGMYTGKDGEVVSQKRVLYLKDEELPSSDETLRGIALIRGYATPENVDKLIDILKKKELTEEDKNFKSKHVDAYNALIPFMGNNLTDAQQFNHPEFTMMIMEAHGKINPSERIRLRNQLESRIDLEKTLEILKPFSYSHEIMDINGNKLIKPHQVKSSEATIIYSEAYQTKDGNIINPTDDIDWSIYLYPKSAKMLYLMDKYQLDGIAFNSTVKVDEKNNLPTLDEILQSNNEDAISRGTYISSMDGYTDQQTVPENKQFDKNIDIGSQIKVLISEGLEEYIDGKSPKEIRDLLDELFILGIEDQTKELEKEIKEYKEVLAKLKSSAIQQGKPVSFINGFDLHKEDNKPNVPLEFPKIRKFVEALMNSWDKGLLNESVPGGTYVNVSAVLTDPDLKIVWKKDESGNPIAIDYIEAAASVNNPSILQLADDSGNIDIKKVYDKFGKEKADKLLTILAYRIPTEDKYSMYPIMITKILPLRSGAKLMLPKEATSITGLDFDIDKMFFIKYAFTPKFDFDSNLAKELLSETNKLIAAKGFHSFDEKTGKYYPIRLDMDRFIRLFSNAYNNVEPKNEDEKSIVNYIQANFELYKDVLLSVELVSPGKNDNYSRHNYRMNIYSEIMQTPSFARSFVDPGSSNILKKMISDINSLEGNLKIKLIEDETSLDISDPVTQADNGKKATTGGQLIGIFANANKHHSIIEDTLLYLNSDNVFNFIGNSYDTIGERINKDGIKISKILASFLFSSTEHIKNPLMDKLGINLDTVNAFIAGVRLGVPLNDLSKILLNPAVKHFVRNNANEKNISGFIIKDIKKELGLSKSDDVLDHLINDMSSTQVKNALVPKEKFTIEQLSVAHKFAHLSAIGEELTTVQLATKFDTDNKFGPEIIENLFKINRLIGLRKKIIEGKTLFSNLEDIVPKIFNNDGAYKILPSKLKLQDKYIEIIVNQLNRNKKYFSYLNTHFSEIHDNVKDLVGSDFLYNKQIKDINEQIYNALAQQMDLSFSDILKSVPNEWVNEKAKKNDRYNTLLSALRIDKFFDTSFLRIDSGVMVGSDYVEKLQDIFEDMLADENTSKFAERLALYGYITSGFSFTPKGFSMLIPDSFLTDNIEGKKIRSLYLNPTLEGVDKYDLAMKILFNKPSLAEYISVSNDGLNVIRKSINSGGKNVLVPIQFDVENFGDDFKSYLHSREFVENVNGTRSELTLLYEHTGGGRYVALQLPSNPAFFSYYGDEDLNMYPDLSPDDPKQKVEFEVESAPHDDKKHDDEKVQPVETENYVEYKINHYTILLYPDGKMIYKGNGNEVSDQTLRNKVLVNHGVTTENIKFHKHNNGTTYYVLPGDIVISGANGKEITTKELKSQVLERSVPYKKC